MPSYLQRPIYGLAFWALGCMFAAASVAGDDSLPVPSADRGLVFAEKLCSGCHVIRAEQEGPAPVGPPPFSSIANKPGQTAEKIRGALVAPHPPMPDAQITNSEMLDVLAYLETLRTDKSAPPLLPPSEQKKPEFPDPT